MEGIENKTNPENMETVDETEEMATISCDDSWKIRMERNIEKSWRAYQKIKDDPEARAKRIAELTAEIDTLSKERREYEEKFLDGEPLVDYFDDDYYNGEFSPEYGEGEFDYGLTAAEEEELIEESENNYVDTTYLSDDELKIVMEDDDKLSDEEYEALVERTRTGNKFCREMYGTDNTEELTAEEKDSVREKLGLPRKYSK